MRIRLIHNQGDVKGTLLITDIDSGLPNEEFGLYRKQAVYVPFYRSYFGSDNLVKIDRTKPGFIDLAPSDKVKLSVDRGVIKGLADNGFLQVIEIATGALAAPTIATADQEGDGAAFGDGDVTITGTNFDSIAPDATSVTLVDSVGGNLVTLTEGDAGVVFGATSIVVDLAAFDNTYAAGTATVTANGQTATATITNTAA